MPSSDTTQSPAIPPYVPSPGGNGQPNLPGPTQPSAQVISLLSSISTATTSVATELPPATNAGVSSTQAQPVQGVLNGYPIAISGSITAVNSSVGTGNAAAPTGATMMGTLVGSNIQFVSATNPVPIYGSGTSGSAAPTTAVALGASDGTNLRNILAVQFHNADNQALGSGYALNTGGVAQTLNAAGTLDRQRSTSFDNVSAVGIASGSQQLAGAPITGTLGLSSATTGNITAGTRTVIVSSLSGTSRGVTYNIMVGSVVQVDTGTSQESVYVTAINTGTPSFTAVFVNSHTAPVAFKAFAYDQARSSTIADGSAGNGISAGAMFLFNGANNGFECERSAAGELDGATGTGTNMAAEYEWQAGGPALASGLATGFAFSRARNVQGKGKGSQTITTSVAGNTSIVFSSAALTNLIQPGQTVTLTGGSTAETVLTTSAWVPGSSATVPLQSPVVNSGQTTATWDIFAAQGPGTSGFTADGIGIEEEALWDPVSGLFYIERAATQDAASGQNIVLECEALYNGSTFDRHTGSLSRGGDQNILATTYSGNALTPGTAISALTVSNIKPSAGNLYALFVSNPNASVIWLQLFNNASTPTLGASVITAIPIGASYTGMISVAPLALANFTTGIAIGAATTASGNTAPGTAPSVTPFYK